MRASIAKLSVNPIPYLGPALWGIASFNILRVVTDLTKKNEFWSGGVKIHSVGLLISVIFCYVITFLWRRRLGRIFAAKPTVTTNVTVEYIVAVVQIMGLLNPTVYVSERLGWVYMGDGYIDYILVNAIYVPLFLLYYMFLRNERSDRNMAENRIYVEQIKADKLDTELQLLKSQYHPHFLFNALNTVYFQIDESNTTAKKSVEQLSELLRYQIYTMDEEVSMEQELAFLTSYIAFQQQRLTARLHVHTDIENDWSGVSIYPLLFQPLIENAFKYVRGAYEIAICLKREGTKIYFSISNSLSGAAADASAIPRTERTESGAGLSNLKKRLALRYPQRHTLHTHTDGTCFLAELILDL
ncbi:sensor histidine kinase [uncultured Sphingobacterium sp.]|uniref:sensor histidine kinase n=1 Tax=uncultured Sphingobacterium sp. TaxID=182688 RepID=UPI0025E75579|nr:histidine kinase [uncultured Sphingobacterium sp.]